MRIKDDWRNEAVLSKEQTDFVWFGFCVGFVCFSRGARIEPPTSKTLGPSSSISVTVVVTGKSESVLPDAFSLSQNYPNPFYQGTAIKYALPEDCFVKLTIYNILGQKVKTLVDRHQTAGYKQVYWDCRDDKGNEIASGVYFYKFKANAHIESKKMMLVK